MSNTAIGRGKKGSKLWIQNVIENEAMRLKLNNMIANNDLIWLSPLSPEYREYQLNEQYIYTHLGLNKEETEKLFSFWPNRQPQWDGIAISQDKATLYLVEAKAHLEELKSKCMAKNENSITKIHTVLKSVMNEHYATGNFDAWLNDYYQLANRLTFLKKLNEKHFGRIKSVKLVLLNFVNDYTYKPTDKVEWQKHYKEVFKEMIGNEDAPSDVLVINYNVSD